jgi:hypothetical protein
VPQQLPCRLPLWSRVFVLIACLGLGGNILVPAARAQGAFTVSLTLDAVAFGELGTIVVAGTLTCSELAAVPSFGPPPFGPPSVSAQVLQPVRRLHTVVGFGFTEVKACDVTPLPFEIVVVPTSGRFAPGIAYVSVSVYVCNYANICDGNTITDAVRLTW